MKSFDIYFCGDILGSHDLAQVKANLGKQFKLTGGKLDALFSGKPVRIKSAVDVDTAGKYREVFRRAGGIVEIVPAGQPPMGAAVAKPAPAAQPRTAAPVEPASPPSAAPDGEMELLPARTGSLIDVARREPPPVEADIDQFDLAPVGSPFPEHEPVPPANIVTDHIQAAPPNSGSLEEFAQHKEPVAIPDISTMAALSPGESRPDDGSAWLEADDGNCDQRVLRGGSWNFRPDNLRSAARLRSYSDDSNDNVGFRLAQDLE